jgi:hypothetical protein
MKAMETIMEFSKNVLAGAVIAAAVALSAVEAPVATAAGNSSATGGGTAEEAGGISTFVFNAVQHGNGAVTGHLVYHVRGIPLTIMMDLDCLNVAGNVATMSGVINQASEVPDDLSWYIFVGQGGVFQVMDNGQGANATPDLFGDLFLEPGASCTSSDVGPAYVPVNGNIQVR